MRDQPGLGMRFCFRPETDRTSLGNIPVGKARKFKMHYVFERSTPNTSPRLPESSKGVECAEWSGDKIESKSEFVS
jgi:hypothetical protein